MTEYTSSPEAIAQYRSSRQRTAHWVTTHTPSTTVFTDPFRSPSLVFDSDDGMSSPASDAESTHSLPPRMLLRYHDGRDVPIYPDDPDTTFTGDKVMDRKPIALEVPPHPPPPPQARPRSATHPPSNAHSSPPAHYITTHPPPSALYIPPPQPIMLHPSQLSQEPEHIHIRPSPTSPASASHIPSSAIPNPNRSSHPRSKSSKHSHSHAHSQQSQQSSQSSHTAYSHPSLRMIYAPPGPTHSHPPPPPHPNSNPILSPSPVYAFPTYPPPDPSKLESLRSHRSSKHRPSSASAASPPAIIYAPSKHASAYAYNPPLIQRSLSQHPSHSHSSHPPAPTLAVSSSDPTPLPSQPPSHPYPHQAFKAPIRSHSRGRLYEHFSRTPSPMDGDDVESEASGSTYYVLPSPGQKVTVVPPIAPAYTTTRHRHHLHGHHPPPPPPPPHFHSHPQQQQQQEQQQQLVRQNKFYAAPPPLQSVEGKRSLLQRFMPHRFGHHAHVESVSEAGSGSRKVLVKKIPERVR
ncbi:hypothetical protein EW146_g9174 [Bondarzewia mesenterica]|uniref:Uncharacterized protein n=1 Tax=Bondarzewia mesenterica TaxID=1095465 RepID=A0A4S4L8W3_9AGAM|nr:hypothetical protein EW146_g9174 [Bondarzewia mesenterica]